MRITESQLRRIVKKLVKEQAMPRAGNFSASDDVAGEVASRWVESGKGRYASIGNIGADDLVDEIISAFGENIDGLNAFARALISYKVPPHAAYGIANTCYDNVM